MSYIGAVPVLRQRPAAAPAATAPVSDHRQVVAWYAAFGAFAAAVFATSGQPVQWTWGAWAAAGYALAALTAALWRSRAREAGLVMALVGALAAPLAWQVTFGRQMPKADESSLKVVARSAVLLLQHGTPYRPADQISHVLGYNPYEPAMAIFGLPAAAGLHGAAGNPRLWMGITAAVVLAAAFRLATPGRALRSTAFVFGSPVLALPLTTGLTDPPVLALLCLTLACTAARQRRQVLLAGAIALGAACAIKATAWPALPVIAAMLAARDGARAATRFVVTAGITTAALVAATAPASVTAPAALFQNTVLFPLGLTRYQTPADSPLPGHLLADTGPAGRWAAIGLLCAVGLAVGASLVVRPPADTRAAACRLAVSLAVVFTLAPASRWGYFAYPAALLGFVSMTGSVVGGGGPAGKHPKARPVKADIAGGLPAAELLAASRQLADRLDELLVAGITACLGSEHGGDVVSGALPVGGGLAGSRIEVSEAGIAGMPARVREDRSVESAGEVEEVGTLGLVKL
jgi:Glycosyltransferase family 87